MLRRDRVIRSGCVADQAFPRLRGSKAEGVRDSPSPVMRQHRCTSKPLGANRQAAHALLPVASVARSVRAAGMLPGTRCSTLVAERWVSVERVRGVARKPPLPGGVRVVLSTCAGWRVVSCVASGLIRQSERDLALAVAHARTVTPSCMGLILDSFGILLLILCSLYPSLLLVFITSLSSSVVIYLLIE